MDNPDITETRNHDLIKRHSRAVPDFVRIAGFIEKFRLEHGSVMALALLQSQISAVKRTMK